VLRRDCVLVCVRDIVVVVLELVFCAKTMLSQPRTRASVKTKPSFLIGKFSPCNFGASAVV
jgi:hypothetical protein